MRIDATRTAYAVYSGAEQPPLGAHSVCFVPPLTQAHAVTRDSRNRARRKRKVRSPHQREEDRYNLYLKLGDYRSASRTPDTFTRGPSPTNTTNNHFQLGFMNQDADPVSSSTYWTPGPCTCAVHGFKPQEYGCAVPKFIMSIGTFIFVFNRIILNSNKYSFKAF